MVRFAFGNLQLDEITLYINSPTQDKEWTLVDNNVKGHYYFFECCPDDRYTDIDIQMDIQRRSVVHIAAVIMIVIGEHL